ncbi:MAG: hypothetical protein IKV13_02665 [Akkermansia sp.]|nr:hypothetical protein [Akkermansia sp.]
MNKQLYIYDCLSGKLRASDGNFMTIGAGEKNTFRLRMKSDNGGSFAQRDNVCRFFPHGHVSSYSLNGVVISTDVVIHPERMYLFVLSGGCFICWYGTDSSRPDFSQYVPTIWYLYNPSAAEWYGPYSLTDLPMVAPELPGDVLATFQGLEHCAFLLRDIVSVAEYAASTAETQIEENVGMVTSPSELRCPNCWELFRPAEILSIASHPELMGDEKLGEHAMRRFLPERWNPSGLPLDSMGVSCNEYACPHCHCKLPPFFTETHQHIISLVGVPAAGKSYFLTSMVSELETLFPREFGMPFRDADPVTNEPLNEMRMRLFSAQTPQEAYLAKTHMHGRLYQKIWKQGMQVNMPRPFIYNLNKDAETHSIVLYDNAGEDFQPGSDTALTPGSQHLSVASGILFLFDPTANPGFRRLLQESTDPQLRNNLYRPGRQALLLAESEMRLRTRLNLPPSEKLQVPLAIIIGKCDTWKYLLGPEALLPAVRNGMFMPEHIDINSTRLRQFIFNIAPHICSSAEAISSNVRYFAASALGESPVEFMDERSGTVLIGPASGSVRPVRVAEPLLWVLHNASPSLIPSSHS